ncbi:hypothetical protein [Cellulomonas cellasea]|uniref:Uncharacterized protein n=1 Tax=Cellulomonas cellasea DSM 20118 TaxID=1408250 RepID=A0A0A0BAC2_9CELL|nr:hypothetical protein [Cellulomonas cellasea]KGM03052.1 hypothetical protein Q760_09615 [Cellulomonas cellasea DSM 20118]
MRTTQQPTTPQVPAGPNHAAGGPGAPDPEAVTSVTPPAVGA